MAVAVEAGRLTFISAQLPVDHTTGRLVRSDQVADHARQVFENLAAVLESAGLTTGEVAHTTLFVTDRSFLPDIDAVYAERFFDKPPARDVVVVADLPLGAPLQLSCIAAS